MFLGYQNYSPKLCIYNYGQSNKNLIRLKYSSKNKHHGNNNSYLKILEQSKQL